MTAFSVSLDYLHRGFDLSDELERKYSVYSEKQPPLNDYLHPKYSLPPIPIDIENQQGYFEFLRTPAAIGSKKMSIARIENGSGSPPKRSTPSEIIV
ncbi:unnamed protein product [Anisakis simplex]|uniref:Uncharacterized protein n=1 Tax=Anisakis simplex TaxID=6269 RepID=A0A0M3KA85_ANISI|nr:unnamed protein product [Anisakis simplex]